MKKINIKQLVTYILLIPMSCLSTMALNYTTINTAKASNNFNTASQTCPATNTFSNGNGGGTNAYTYNNVESLSIDFGFMDNSFTVSVNGTQLHSLIIEMESDEFGAGDIQILFQDNTEMVTPWLPNSNGLPRVRVEIDPAGNVTLLGTRTTTSTALEIMTTNNGTSFNIISFPAGASTVIITNIDEGGADGMSGTVTANEVCTAGVWSKNGATLYYDAGNVAVNTDVAPVGYAFAVKGKIIAEEIKVQVFPWADFVFKEDYNLPTLAQVEQHIKEKGHLQYIPSAKEVAKNGIQLGEINSKLLQKIEELTLYTIQQQKELQQQQEYNKSLESRLHKIELLLKTKD